MSSLVLMGNSEGHKKLRNDVDRTAKLFQSLVHHSFILESSR